MSLVESVKCQRNCKIKKKLKIIFFNSNLHSIHKEKHNFEEIFFREFFLNFINEGVLCQVFHLNKDKVFY